jgi:mannonate dehydratase
VRGVVPKYTEVFIDEGDIDMVQAMKVWKDAGYTGPMVSDHTPGVEGETAGGHVGRAFSLGFMRAAVQAVNTLA